MRTGAVERSSVSVSLVTQLEALAGTGAPSMSVARGGRRVHDGAGGRGRADERVEVDGERLTGLERDARRPVQRWPCAAVGSLVDEPLGQLAEVVPAM